MHLLEGRYRKRKYIARVDNTQWQKLAGEDLLENIDDLDMKIIEELCKSSQGSYRQIARRLGIHPATLIQRVKNLEERRIIRGYRASVDYLKLGYEFMAIVHIYVEGDLLEVQKRIRSIKNVVAVFDVTGECDSIAWIACRNREEFSNVIKGMLQMPGVKKTSTYVVLNVIKEPYEFMPDFHKQDAILSE